MGFTIEDMLIISKSKYKMEMIAGRNGWANSISWLLMVEDTVITRDFRGKELVVTTGLGFGSEEKLLDLVKALDERHAAGLIINTGYYIKEIPESIIKFCDHCDLPLLTTPWDVTMSEMIKDLTVRIFFQTQTDEQTSAALIKAIEKPGLKDEYIEELSQVFDVDGRFQIILLTTDDLDSMDSVERKRIGYRLQIYLENISHNGHFFYYNGYFVLALNAVDDASAKEIIEGFMSRATHRMPDRHIYVGVGSAVNDASNIAISFRRAVFAARMSIEKAESLTYFDNIGVKRLFYSISDPLILKEMSVDILEPILEYDREHKADLTLTLHSYLENGGSIKAVSDELFIHKNTIVYRMNKIKELLNTDLENGRERLMYYLATELLSF